MHKAMLSTNKQLVAQNSIGNLFKFRQKKCVCSQKKKLHERKPLWGSLDMYGDIAPVILWRLQPKLWCRLRDLLNKLVAGFICSVLEFIILLSSASNIHFQSLEWLICLRSSPNRISHAGSIFPSSKHSFRHTWNEAPIPEEHERTPISTTG